MSIVNAGVAVCASTLSTLLTLARTRTFARSALGLGALVALLLALHVARLLTGGELSPLAAHALDIDRGVSERFEYLMSLTAVAALLLGFRATRQSIYAALASVHLWLLLDNSLRLHENLGWRLEAWLVSVGGPPLGESVVFLGVVLAIALGVGLALRRAEGPHRDMGLALVAVAAPMAAFAAGVDLVHGRLATLSPAIDQAFILVEDGGELAIFALNAAFALAAAAALANRRATYAPLAAPPAPPIAS